MVGPRAQYRDVRDGRVLAILYIELKTSFGLLGMIGFAFSVVSRLALPYIHASMTLSLTDSKSWSALGGVFVTGVGSGGPPVMI